MKKTSKTSVNDYLLKIKEIADALGSIGAQTDVDDLVSSALNGLKGKENWKPFAISVYDCENFRDFDELKALMITKERNIGGPCMERGSCEPTQAFYSGNSRDRGCRFSRGYGRGRLGGH